MELLSIPWRSFQKADQLGISRIRTIREIANTPKLKEHLPTLHAGDVEFPSRTVLAKREARLVFFNFLKGFCCSRVEYKVGGVCASYLLMSG